MLVRIGTSRAPTHWRPQLATALVALLVIGTGPARAAEPTSALDSLPGRVAGVVGSGDKLSLRLTGSDGARTIAIGETIDDGWVLSALSSSVATLTKAGQTRQVGLNPAGALASLAAPQAARVDMAGAEAMLTLSELVRMIAQPNRSTDTADQLANWQTSFNNAVAAAPGATPVAGLDAGQTQRFFEMSNRIEALKVAIRKGEAPAVPFFTEDLAWPGQALIAAALGPDAAEYVGYLATIDDNNSPGMLRRQLAENPITGPSSYYVPAGARSADVMAQEGVDRRGTWLASLPDADGGQTYTRLSEVGGAQQLRNMAQAQAALRDGAAIAAGADPAQFGMTAAGAATLMATLPASVRAAARQ